MTTPEPSESGKVSLGELLRLKRAERPAPEFWARFEQDLRAKQLAAIVEKRPWWVALRLPQASRALAQWRLQLPLGATAVLALSFVVVSEYRSHPAITSAARTEGSVKIATAPVSHPARELAATAGPQVDSVPVRVPVSAAFPRLAPGVKLSESTPTVASMAVTAAAAPAEPMAVVGAPPSAVALERERTPSAVDVIELPTVVFDALVTTEAGQGFDTSLETEGVSAQWIQMSNAVGGSRAAPTSPREVRRGRILASLVLADNSADGRRFNPSYVREVQASALSDASGYDNLSRIGMGGDRLTLKF